MMRSVQLCVALVLLIVTSPAAAERQVMCFLPPPGNEPAALHAAYALQYYSSRFSSGAENLTWGYKFLGGNKGTTNEAVTSFVLSASDCSFVIGPGYSYLAVALSAVIQIPWIESSASSVALSAEQQPFFNRVIPTDDVGASNMAGAMKKFGWTRAHVLCVEEPYALSYARAVTEVLVDAGGGQELSQCFGTQAQEPELEAFIDRILAHPNRVLIVSSLASTVTFANLLNVMQRRRVHESLLIIWAEAICSTDEKNYLRIPGTLCLAYYPDEAFISGFLQSYQSRDSTADAAALAAIGITGIDMTLTNTYAALAHDATMHMMNTITRNVRYGLNTSVTQSLREVETEVSTGTVNLNARTGNRPNANMVLLNTLPNGQEVPVGYVREGGFDWPDEPLTNVFLLNRSYARDALPSASVAQADEEPVVLTELSIIVISVAGVLVVAIVGATIVKWRKSQGRDNSRAPKEESKEIAVVFTDIQRSTALWTIDPEAMSAAVEQHHTEIRKQVAKFGGYEVKTVGDAFMVVFTDALEATRFAMGVQTGLHSLKWKEVFDRFYKRTVEEESSATAVGDEDEYQAMWNGLRVRVGVHIGLCNVHFDPVTFGYDYYGTTVNTAARVETIGHGGQTLITDTVVDALGDQLAKQQIRLADLGPQPLAGVDEPVRVYQVLPTAFANRKFPALRLSNDVTDVVVLDDESTVNGGSVLPTASQDHVLSSGDGEVNGGLAALDGNLSTTVPTGMEEAYSLSKHIGGSQNRVDVTHRLVDFQNFVKVLLSTLGPEDRPTFARVLCRHWGVEYPKGLTYYGDPTKFDSVLLKVVYKAFKVYDASFRMSTRDHRRNSQSGAPTPMTFKLQPVRVNAFQMTPTPDTSRASSVSTLVSTPVGMLPRGSTASVVRASSPPGIPTPGKESDVDVQSMNSRSASGSMHGSSANPLVVHSI